MTGDHHRRIIPAVFCGIAVLALTAAGYILYDSRDHLTTIDDDEVAFVSYSADQEQTSPPSDEDLTQPEIADSDYHSDDEWVLDDEDWAELADQEQWEILEPAESRESTDATTPSSSTQPGSGPAGAQATGRLVVVTNFSRADVVINGDPYPAYSDDGQNRGMELNANEAHEVYVEFDGNERLYEITLAPGERRLLMVELTGMGQSAAAPPDRTERRRRRSEPDDDDEVDDEKGRITVYSRPRGAIYVGNEDMDEQTPGTVQVEAGRHEVQVEYREGEMSETKTVRVREGSRVKLFFREDD